MSKPSDFIFGKLSNDLHQNALTKIIKNELNLSEGEFSLKLEAGSSKGDNYIGQMQRVTVFDLKNDEKLKVVIKTAPENEDRRDKFKARDCFLHEINFYADVYPKFKKFQEEKGINVTKDGFHQVPKFYTSVSDEFFEGLFMEDIKVSGFEMFSRFEKLTKNHVLIVLKALAKFHAIGFAMKDQKPKEFSPYTKMKDVFLSNKNDRPMADFFNKAKVQTIEVLETCSDPIMINRFKEFLSLGLYEAVEDVLDIGQIEPYATVCHGDCWSNNFMFHYDELGNVDDVRLLDWQIIRYLSPVTDLVYFIFTCTVKELRDEYFELFMDVYHETLSSYIKRLGSDPNKLYPRDVFDSHLKRYGRFGLVLSVFCIPIFTSDPDDSPDLDEFAKTLGDPSESSENKFISSKTADKYAERMKGVLEDMNRLGYL